MTATSGPGFSLKQENIGYACLAEIPLVIVDVQRTGPSTGMPTSPAQGDVMMARWGTHGDHPIIVLCPSSVKETYDLTVRSFNLSEKYRTPVILLMDEIIGHLREGMELPDPEELEIIDRPTVRFPEPKRLPYHMKKGQTVPAMAPFGCGQRYNITGLIHDETGFPTNSHEEAEKLMYRLMHKISDNYDDIVRSEERNTEDADTLIVCYGGTMRAATEAMERAREKGMKVGIFRPITIWPFPERELKKVEITLKLQNHIFRAEAKDDDILNAVDRTVDKLESQIRKQKTRIQRQKKEYPIINEYLNDIVSEDYEEEDNEPKIIKRKSFELVPMESEEAILQMEMLGHSFLVDLDAQTGTVCVVYKRKDGQYGLIEPTY